jgi:spore maturation protein CgeB
MEVIWMKIGLYMKWPKGSLNWSGNVIGDELYGEAMCKSLRSLKNIHSAVLYAPNYMPTEKLDLMIYLNDTEPMETLANKHFLYFQNAYNEGSDLILKRMQAIGYDGYAFISNQLLMMHRESGYEGIFLPFGVDISVFNPKQPDSRYQYEVSYVGNDIKGEERTTRYIYPARHYNFGLFGNWKFTHQVYKFWKTRSKLPYQKLFHQITKGKIPQEDVPILYSSTKINLNCTAQDCVDWDVITLRTFEVLACKGFLISDKVPIAEKLLTDGVVFTDGGPDLISKIDYYLAKPKEREAIAQHGYEYVHANATIAARMKELANYIERIMA